MEQAKLARLLAVVVATIVYATAASQGELWNLGIAFAVAVVASLGIWFQPPTDLGNWAKLRDHLLLSVPLAGLSVVGGLVLFTDGSLQFTAIFGLFIGLFTTASVLEQRLMGDKP
jgi:hypothetical protein